MKDTSPAPAPAARQSRTAVLVALIAGAAFVIAAVAVAVAIIVTSRGGPAVSPTGAADSTPMANGIARPDASCVTTDGRDHQDMWNANGWWAGRIDGTPKEMGAFAVLQLKINGREVDSAWICAPRPGS